MAPRSSKIYDLKGLEVRRLVNESQAAKEHIMVWDGRDQSGSAVSSGVYFSQLIEK